MGQREGGPGKGSEVKDRVDEHREEKEGNGGHRGEERGREKRPLYPTPQSSRHFVKKLTSS